MLGLFVPVELQPRCGQGRRKQLSKIGLEKVYFMFKLYFAFYHRYYLFFVLHPLIMDLGCVLVYFPALPTILPVNSRQRTALRTLQVSSERTSSPKIAIRKFRADILNRIDIPPTAWQASGKRHRRERASGRVDRAREDSRKLASGNEEMRKILNLHRAESTPNRPRLASPPPDTESASP